MGQECSATSQNRFSVDLTGAQRCRYGAPDPAPPALIGSRRGGREPLHLRLIACFAAPAQLRAGSRRWQAGAARRPSAIILLRTKDKMRLRLRLNRRHAPWRPKRHDSHVGRDDPRTSRQIISHLFAARRFHSPLLRFSRRLDAIALRLRERAPAFDQRAIAQRHDIFRGDVII